MSCSIQSSDRFIQLFGELRKQFITVRDSPMGQTSEADYANIDTQFMSILNDPDLGDGENLVTACLAREEQLDLERSELETELERLRQTLADEQAVLQSRISGDYEEIVEDVSEELGSVQDKKLYRSYCTQVAELAAGLAVAKSVFTGLLGKSVTDIREERVCATDARFADPVSWAGRREQLGRLMADVESKAGQLNLSPPSKEEVQLVEVDELAAEAAKHLAAAAKQRKKRDEHLAVFYVECDKLTVWCRQQLANLDAMQEPDHIQEYCRTLADNYATMSNNFAVLVESVAPYIQANHVPVRQALLQAQQVWYHVLVASLERLTRTLFEIHPKSVLEDEVEKYAPCPQHLAELLKTIRILLQQETELSEEAKSVLQACERLSTEVAARAAATVQRLRDFAARTRADRNGYQCFREAILSRLTYANPPADVVLDSKRRQMEFEECVKELKTWAAAQAHGESWRDIYSKIVEIKRVIQQEQEYVDERAGVPMN